MSKAKPQVYVTRPDIPDEAMAQLRKSCDVESWSESCPVPRGELLQRIRGKDALFCMVTDKINAELLDAAGISLKAVGTMSVGHEHIDLDECKKRNVLVGNTPDVLTDATAELGVALLLATSRRLFEARAEIDNGGWGNVAWSPVWMCGTALKGSTVGIVGFGRIGQAVAERLKPFRVKEFLYSGHTEKPEGVALGARLVPFDTLLADSDFVIVCCSLNKETAGLFNQNAFSRMKKSAIFINISRGGVVDQDALHHALSTNQIKAAGLDVMTPEPLPVDHPFLKMTNCTLLPHIGSANVETRSAMAMLTSANILAALEGKQMPCPLV